MEPAGLELRRISIAKEMDPLMELAKCLRLHGLVPLPAGWLSEWIVQHTDWLPMLIFHDYPPMVA